MQYRLELIEHFRNGSCINAVKEEIPNSVMSNGYSRFVNMSEGHDDHFKVTAVFSHGELFINHYHIFHTPNAILVYLKCAWQEGPNGRLWVKYNGMNEFMILGEINDSYEPGIILGPQFDDYYARQWFETKPDGKMVEYDVERDNKFVIHKEDDYAK